MTRTELYKLYLKVHDLLTQGDCKSSCREMTFNQEVSFDPSFGELEPFYFIKCGTYCIADGRWETVGMGKSEEKAIEVAADFLRIYCESKR